MDRGFRGFTVTHESDYFSVVSFFHQNLKEGDQWIAAVQEEA